VTTHRDEDPQRPGSGGDGVGHRRHGRAVTSGGLIAGILWALIAVPIAAVGARVLDFVREPAGARSNAPSALLPDGPAREPVVLGDGSGRPPGEAPHGG
jgi:hypothetical protein